MSTLDPDRETLVEGYLGMLLEHRLRGRRDSSLGADDEEIRKSHGPVPRGLFSKW